MEAEIPSPDAPIKRKPAPRKRTPPSPRPRSATEDRKAKWFHELFEASLAVKAFFASTETLFGIALYFIGSDRVVALANRFTLHELSQLQPGLVSRIFNHATNGLTIDTVHFYAIYLLSHGIVKLAMVLALFLRAMWAYPASMVLLGFFIVYQIHRYTQTGANTLIALSLFDAVMILLIWREYKSVPKPKPKR